jgi:hypothetical protein
MAISSDAEATCLLVRVSGILEGVAVRAITPVAGRAAAPDRPRSWWARAT